MAMVSNDSRYVEGALSKLVDFVRTVPQVELDRLPDRASVEVNVKHVTRDQTVVFTFHVFAFILTMSRRTEMLGSTIQQELAEIIMRELNDPRLTGDAEHHAREGQPGPVDRRRVRHDHGHAGPADRRAERAEALGRA